MTIETLCVLIVDDDHLIRGYLKAMLGELKLTHIIEAGTGAQALRANQSKNPDIVLLDINLPDSDGVSLLSQIRATNPTCKIVMVSHEATKDRVKSAIENGATGFIVKPFNTATILATLGKLLESKLPPLTK